MPINGNFTSSPTDKLVPSQLTLLLSQIPQTLIVISTLNLVPFLPSLSFPFSHKIYSCLAHFLITEMLNGVPQLTLLSLLLELETILLESTEVSFPALTELLPELKVFHICELVSKFLGACPGGCGHGSCQAAPNGGRGTCVCQAGWGGAQCSERMSQRRV